MTNPGQGASVIETILTRRSTRTGYTPDRVADSAIKTILACGLAAPSSKDARPWRFHVVRSSVLLTTFAQALRAAPDAATYVPRDPATGEPRANWPSSVFESADVLAQVSTAIFVENRGPFSGTRRGLRAATHENLLGSLVGYTLEIAGIGAAIENMWLATEALGLRAAFMGDVVIAEDEISRHLAFDGDLIGVLVVGSSTAIPTVAGPKEDTLESAHAVWHQ